MRRISTVAVLLLLVMPNVGFGKCDPDQQNQLIEYLPYNLDDIDDEDLYIELVTAIQNLRNGVQAAQDIASPPPIPAQPGISPAEPTDTYDWFDQLFNLILGETPRSRDDTFRGLQPPPNAQPAPGTGPPPGSNNTGPGSGFYQFVNPSGDPNKPWGTGGCGPCVGVIVQLPDGSIVIFHFSPGDNVAGTLTQFAFPPGTTFVIFGGDNSDVSLLTLARAIAWVKLMNDINNNVYTLYAFPYVSGLWVNQNGQWVYIYDKSKEVKKAVPNE